MNNNIQCSIESSTTSMELNSATDGIFLVPELEGLAGLPEIRTTSGVNAGYDGGWTSAQNYDARLIAIRGVIADKDIAKVEATRRKLASLLGQGRKEQLTLHFTTEAGNAYTISVRTISCEMALQRVLNKQDFLIQLRADDPLIYDDGASGGTEAVLRVQQALGGFEINFGLPLAIGGSSDATAVENGAETVYPIIKLYGPLHSPTVVNMTTNQQMQIIADLGYTITWSGWTGVSGERLSIPNELDKEAPLRFWGFDGNIEQASYAGKNLSYASSVNPSSVGSWALTNGSIKNTAYTGSIANLVLNMATTNLSANETAYVSCDIRLVSGAASFSKINDNAVNYTSIQAPTISSSFQRYIFSHTYDSAKTFSTMLVQFTNLTNGVVEVKNVMVAKSNADYEPYVGGQPSPSPTYPQPIETVTGRQTVGVVSKNLYDPNSTVFSVPANVSVEVEGNSVKVTALITTTSSNLYWRTPIPDSMLEDGKTYTISSVLGSGAHRSLRLLLRNHDGSNAGFSTGYSVTYDSRYTLFVVENPFATTDSTQVTAGTTCTISNIQVEEGSTATAYEPYEGQDYEINLGKNLFDKNNPNVVRGYIAGTNLTGGTDYTIYIPCEENTTYTIQKMVAVPQTANRFRINSYATEPTAGSTSISSSYFWNAGDGSATTTHTYTTPTGAKYLGVTVMTANTTGTTTASDMYASIQIEKGYTASSYFAYFEPIELCKIGDYQDRIYKENGKWWLEKQTGKVVLDGSEDWHKSSNTQVDRYWYNIYSGEVVPSFHQIYSDKFFYEYNVPTVNAMWVDVYQTLERLFVNYASYGTTTVTDLKTWLASNPTTVYYPLATPTTTEITNEEVLEGLEALGDATLYVGTNNIYTDTPSALPTLEVDYPTDYDETHDTIIIDSQARTITLNGADIYHLKTEESEFPVLAPGENRMYLTSATTSDTGYAEVKFKQGYLSI